MNSWEVHRMELRPHAPQILSSTSDARAIALAIPAGESLDEHQVHERAWIAVLSGRGRDHHLGGRAAQRRSGTRREFDPNERHAVRAVSDTRLLLLLTPWPGEGHPGSMSLEDKSHARERAAEHRDRG
jgi:quercetin dioxygenase-like cupin family protein